MREDEVEELTESSVLVFSYELDTAIYRMSDRERGEMREEIDGESTDLSYFSKSLFTLVDQEFWPVD